MKFFYLILFLLFFFISFSCTKKNGQTDPLDFFPTEIHIKGSILKTDKEILHGAELRLIDDSILVIKNVQSEMYLTFVNLNGNKVMKELIKKGRGPGELFALDFCRHISRDTLWVYDILLHSVYRINVIEALKNSQYQIEKKAYFSDYPPLIPIWTGNMFVGSGGDVDGRFGLYNQNGDYLKKSLMYLKPEKYKDFPERVFATGFQGCYAISSENKKIAFATFQSGSIHIFNYFNNSVETVKELNFFDPEMKRDNWVCAFSYKKTRSGFSSIDTDHKYIYLLYSGRLMSEYPYEFNHCEYLLVFDWNGKPIKKYKLDNALISMCLNGKADKLYGIAYLPETTIIQYDLE